MFTIKYRTYVLAPEDQQPPADCLAPKQFYNEHEMIEGPFVLVSKEMVDGWPVVYAHRNFDSPGMTYGPIKVALPEAYRPIVWVMNEQGATVAKYEL